MGLRIFLEKEELVFKAELALEELNILHIVELFWLGGRLPNPGCFILDEGDVFLVLLDFSAVECGAFTLDDAAVGQFADYLGAERSWKVVVLPFLLMLMIHIE